MAVNALLPKVDRQDAQKGQSGQGVRLIEELADVGARGQHGQRTNVREFLYQAHAQGSGASHQVPTKAVTPAA